MTEIRKHWTSELPPIPEDELALVRRNCHTSLGDAACAFWLFRFLHRVESPVAVLMGDYCFGRFSGHLAMIDSVELTNAFAAYLKQDVLLKKGMDDYLAFLKSVSGMT